MAEYYHNAFVDQKISVAPVKNLKKYNNGGCDFVISPVKI